MSTPFQLDAEKIKHYVSDEYICFHYLQICKNWCQFITLLLDLFSLMTGGVIHISDASLLITEAKVNKSNNSSIESWSAVMRIWMFTSQGRFLTNVLVVADSPNVAATLPLFVTELQDPLNILLGHKVIIFQCLKENRWHSSGKIVLHNTGYQGSMHPYLTNVQERAELNMIS